MLQCDQSVSDVELLVDKLNQTNGLFKFVRAMRKKFQSAAENGIFFAIFHTSLFLSSFFFSKKTLPF